ncbi:WG repeat-containing protein [uncultured Gemmiger sp.]|uniref:WG repeat-containing protein n=1 Tax=uncultured Gemmiger sp. TaxID=1623490 RepID=UPI0025CDBC67|nr:WG repeat-containing protein [uncultured Gemmiger sp.]
MNQPHCRKVPVFSIILWVLFGLLALAALVLGLLLFLRGRANARLVQQHLDLGEKYLAQLDYDSAVIEFTSAIRIDERCAPAYQGRGDAYLALADYESAEADYTVVIEVLRQPSVDLYVDRARAHAGQDEVEQAEADLQHAADMGLSEDELTQIRDEIFVTLPLSAEDVTWLVEPEYDYQNVVPLRGNSFSDIAGDYSDGQQPIGTCFYEMSFPGYSNLPQYYQVQLADGSWRLYYMPDHIDSGDIQMDAPVGYTDSFIVARYDASGIINYIDDGAVLFEHYPAPWYLFTTAERGGGSMQVYYDTATRQGLTVGKFYGHYITPVSQSGLHKPYPAGRLDTSASGLDYSQPLVLEAGTEDSPGNLFYDTVESNAQNYPKAYVGTDGQLITDFLYDRAEDFSEGIAACCKNGKWGYIDETGAEITDFVYDGVWACVGPYDPNYGEFGGHPTEYTAYPCTSDTMVVYQNGQAGLLYRDGTLLIDFGAFEDLAPAYNNELWAKQDGRWGLVDLAAVKRRAHLSAELSVPAKTELPDPPYFWVETQQQQAPENVPIDYPATQSQLYDFYQRVSEDQLTAAAAPLYTGPAATYTLKTTIPAGESVRVYGGTRTTADWVYVGWTERVLTDPGAALEFQRYTTTNYYGWVQLQSLTPAPDQ